jgi:hypothetical protein
MLQIQGDDRATVETYFDVRRGRSDRGDTVDGHFSSEHYGEVAEWLKARDC